MKFLKQYRRAFSLLEMLVVVGILAVFSAFAIVSYGSFRQGLWIKNSAKELEALLNNARTRAINQNSYFQVVFDFSSRQFWVDETLANGNIKNPKVIQPVILEENIEIPEIGIDSTTKTSGLAKIRFYPDGKSSYARLYLIKKDDDKTVALNYYTVMTYASTGHTHIYPNQKR